MFHFRSFASDHSVPTRSKAIVVSVPPLPGALLQGRRGNQHRGIVKLVLLHPLVAEHTSAELHLAWFSLDLFVTHEHHAVAASRGDRNDVGKPHRNTALTVCIKS